MLVTAVNRWVNQRCLVRNLLDMMSFSNPYEALGPADAEWAVIEPPHAVANLCGNLARPICAPSRGGISIWPDMRRTGC
jgi:hypothetical protein